MLPDDALASLVERHKATQNRIISRAAPRIAGAWDDLESIDRDQVDRFLASIAPFLTAAKKASFTAAVAFYSTIFETRPPAIPISEIATEYAGLTPFTATWHALDEGRPYAEAVQAGRSIAEAQTSRFVVGTGRQTGDAVATATGQRVRWRRVPSAGACPFCTNAAGQLYRTAATADFGHDRCGCAAVPTA